jgi:two-component system sensor histidine kinase KdpD
MTPATNARTLAAPRLGVTARRALSVLAVVGSLGLATVAAAILEGGPFQLVDASPIYLIAVVGVGIVFGTWPAIVTAIASFLLYDLLFVEPRFTLSVENPNEWLDLLLFLVVSVAIGRLSALQNERATEAARRAREAEGLFRISRALAAQVAVADALRTIVADLASEIEMDRVWVSRAQGARETVVADSQAATPTPRRPIHFVLARATGTGHARWIRTHQGSDVDGGGTGGGAASEAEESRELFRVRIESGGEPLGSLWASRRRGGSPPSAEETRLLSLAADQLGLAYRRERLATEANAAEVARQSDRVKSALLDSVSHDLQTPLASIRTAAGSLMDPAVDWSERDRQAAAMVIDQEAERLSSLVRNLLDMSRIEAGALKPDLELFDLPAIVEPVVKRVQATNATPVITVETLAELPPVRVDAVYFDELMTNLLENAVRHARGARVRIRAGVEDHGRAVVLRVEDGGPGVPVDALPHLFEKFYRVSRPGEGSRRGLGIGLSVVKGLVEAMGGTVRANQSELGGLAIEVALAAAPAPPAERSRA